MEVDDDPCKASTDPKVRLPSDHGRVWEMRVLEELTTVTRRPFDYFIIGDVPYDHLRFNGRAWKRPEECELTDRAGIEPDSPIVWTGGDYLVHYLS